MSAVNINVSFFDNNDSDLEFIGELYGITFIGEDYSPEDKYNAVVNIKKHASYEGFKGLKAKDTNGKLIGFAYGYSSLPEQFYRGKIEAQLSETQTNNWLSDCFEFVELAVDPSYKRLGIASQLHDTLLDNIDHKTSILTTWVNNSPAINLYKNKGWELIKVDAPVITKENPQVIMGKTTKQI